METPEHTESLHQWVFSRNVTKLWWNSVLIIHIVLKLFNALLWKGYSPWYENLSHFFLLSHMSRTHHDTAFEWLMVVLFTELGSKVAKLVSQAKYIGNHFVSLGNNFHNWDYLKYISSPKPTVVKMSITFLIALHRPTITCTDTLIGKLRWLIAFTQ